MRIDKDNSCATVRRASRGGVCCPDCYSRHGSHNCKVNTINDLVKCYVRTHVKEIDEELSFYKRQKSLVDTIKVAAICEGGNRHPHQRRLTQEALDEFCKRLSDKKSSFQVAEGFDEIYSVVRKVGHGVYGIGPLATYDFAQRIGLKLGKYTP